MRAARCGARGSAPTSWCRRRCWCRAPGDGAREDDGWLLALVYRGGTDSSYLAVLDAARLEDGPVARVHFDHEIPVTFHGNWLPA
jgi:carotenoid cleavage dioxygenase-like enzyme